MKVPVCPHSSLFHEQLIFPDAALLTNNGPRPITGYLAADPQM